jgi:hypothetical protein
VSEFPGNNGDRESIVLQEAIATLEGSNRKYRASRAVEETRNERSIPIWNINAPAVTGTMSVTLVA